MVTMPYLDQAGARILPSLTRFPNGEILKNDALVILNDVFN